MTIKVKKLLRRWLPKLGLTLKSDTDWAYEQRDIAAMIAATYAGWSGCEVSLYQDDQENWDDEWRTVLQIHGITSMNEGQVSWHLGPKAQKVAKEVFKYGKKQEWDGTDFSKDLEIVKKIKW